ncbi:hypothetical protein CsSME_00046085 [Camellia sinensis var. sinensis]
MLQWQDLCQYYMKEARWSYNGFMPTLQEYLNHAWTSSSITTLLTDVYFLSSNAITKELERLEKYHDIIKWSSMVDLQMIWEHHGCVS